MTELKECNKPGCSLYAAPDHKYCFVHKEFYPNSVSTDKEVPVKKKPPKKKLK